MGAVDTVYWWRCTLTCFFVYGPSRRARLHVTVVTSQRCGTSLARGSYPHSRTVASELQCLKTLKNQEKGASEEGISRVHGRQGYGFLAVSLHAAHTGARREGTLVERCTASPLPAARSLALAHAKRVSKLVT